MFKSKAPSYIINLLFIQNKLKKLKVDNRSNIFNTALFWLYFQPIFLRFFFFKALFFFKVFKVKKTSKKVLRKKFSIKQNFGKIKKRKYCYKIKWCSTSITPISLIKKKKKIFKKKYGKWARFNLKFTSKYRLRKRFLKHLKKRLLTAQLTAGSLLFGTNKKVVLRKVFSLFRGLKNRPINFILLKKFHLLTLMFYSIKLKYRKLFNFFKLSMSNHMPLIHINLLDTFTFFKYKERFIMTKRRLFPLSTITRKYRRVKRRKHAINKRVLAAYYKSSLLKKVRFTTFYKEMLTKTISYDLGSENNKTYYLNYILNIWNVRTYNWKQIT